MKKCPYCAEEIRDETVSCRYCGRDVTLAGRTRPLKPVRPKPVQKSISKVLPSLNGPKKQDK